MQTTFYLLNSENSETTPLVETPSSIVNHGEKKGRQSKQSKHMVTKKNQENREVKNSSSKKTEQKKQYKTSLVGYAVETQAKNLTLNYHFQILDLASNQQVSQGFSGSFVKTNKAFLYDIFFHDHDRVVNYAKNKGLKLEILLEWVSQNEKTGKKKRSAVSVDDLFSYSSPMHHLTAKVDETLLAAFPRSASLISAKWAFALDGEGVNADEITGFILFLRSLKRSDRLVKTLKKLMK